MNLAFKAFMFVLSICCLALGENEVAAAFFMGIAVAFPL